MTVHYKALTPQVVNSKHQSYTTSQKIKKNTITDTFKQTCKKASRPTK